MTSWGGGEMRHDRGVGDRQRQSVVKAETKRKVKRLSRSEKGSTKSCEMSRDTKWDQAPVRLMEGVAV